MWSQTFQAADGLQHVVGVFDGARQRVTLAIDGVVVAEQATRAPCRLAACTAPLSVGALFYEGELGGGGGGELPPPGLPPLACWWWCC